MKKIKSFAMLLAILFSSSVLNAQVKTQPDNTRVKKETPVTEEQKLSIEGFISTMKMKIYDLEKRIDKIKTEADEKMRTQRAEYKRILANLELNKKNLKEKINSFKDTTAEKSDKFKKEVSKSYKNLVAQTNALSDEVSKPDKAVLKREDGY